MTSTYECLVSALLVKDLLEHCMASCLALLYIEIPSLLQRLKWTMAATNLPQNLCQQGDNNEKHGVVSVFMCLPRVYSNIIYMDCLPLPIEAGNHYQVSTPLASECTKTFAVYSGQANRMVSRYWHCLFLSVSTGSQSGDSKTYWGHQNLRLPLPWCKQEHRLSATWDKTW